MKKLIVPDKLKKGDKVALVSLSWGGAGDEDLLWRYQVGKKRLKDIFGLVPLEMDHTLKGSQFIYENPQKRAEDLMKAFKDPDIKGIFANIGGDDSIRMLPYIDFDVIRKNPKIFLGYSDSTITHLILFKAGVRSYYGPSILAEFAENVKIFDYTREYVEKTLFTNEDIGDIPQAKLWSGERIEWLEENKDKTKTMYENTGYEVLQGKGIVEGPLFGGCIDVLEMAKGTDLWPEVDQFDGTILFLESSEEIAPPSNIVYWLRNYGIQGILHRLRGIIFAKPYQEKYFNEYKDSIKKVLKEFQLEDLPVMYNMSFGHNQPMHIIPYGASGLLDLDNKKFAIKNH